MKFNLLKTFPLLSSKPLLTTAFTALSFTLCALSEPTSPTAEAVTLNFMQEEESCSFVAPIGWQSINPTALPENVRVLVRGKSPNEIPPTLNLALEHSDLSLEQYLATVKAIHNSTGRAQWSRLGTIETQAGEAVLTQITQESQWGELKLMQAIFMRQGIVYVLTATALREEFPQNYQDFFKSIQSFSVTKNVLDRVENEEKRRHLQQVCQQLKAIWPTYYEQAQEEKSDLPPETLAIIAFEQPVFQEEHWKPFKNLISSEFKEMGDEWQYQVVKKMHEELLATQRLNQSNEATAD